MSEARPGDLLPTAYVPSPECGHCYTALQDDGDGYQCDQCGLWWAYTAMDEPGEYVDDEASPCGKAGRDRVEFEGKVFRERPCPLPTGHKSQHLHEFELIEEATA